MLKFNLYVFSHFKDSKSIWTIGLECLGKYAGQSSFFNFLNTKIVPQIQNKLNQKDDHLMEHGISQLGMDLDIIIDFRAILFYN